MEQQTLQHIKEIQTRLENAMQETMKNTLIWNRTMAAALSSMPSTDISASEELHNHAEEDLIWLMQQFITTDAMLVSKMNYIEDLKNRFIYNQDQK